MKDDDKEIRQVFSLKRQSDRSQRTPPAATERPKRHIDEDLLATVIETLDSTAKREKMQLTHEDRAAAQAAVYAASSGPSSILANTKCLLDFVRLTSRSGRR